MKDRVNSYLAIFFILIAGAGAAVLIIHVANTNAFSVTNGSEASYASLQQSILKQ